MTEFENTSARTEEDVPLPEWLVGITKKKAGLPDIKPLVHKALKDTETAKKVTAILKKPKDGNYYEGSAIDDKIAITEIIVAYDTKHGAGIINSGLNNKQKRDSVFVVLRHYYDLDQKTGKYKSINTKHYLLLK